MANTTELQQTTHKISIITLVFMVIIAVILDLISLIPILNIASLVLGACIFTLWWWKLGLGLVNLKKIITYATSSIIEIIPVISWIPSITIAVIVIFVISRTEEKTGVNLSAHFKKGARSGKGQPRAVVPARNQRTNIRPSRITTQSNSINKGGVIKKTARKNTV